MPWDLSLWEWSAIIFILGWISGNIVTNILHSCASRLIRKHGKVVKVRLDPSLTSHHQ